METRTIASFPSVGTDPDVLDAMAMLARETGLVVHVIAPRGPGLIERARRLAEQGGLTVEADLLSKTLRVRFSH
ncbi:MAG TPA: hypothetical protein VGL99_07790 [Chloroflexota bacterium]